MATVSPYPTPSQGGPVINIQIDLPEEFQSTTIEYDDGGVDINVIPCGVLRWRLEYEGLTTVEAGSLDDHFDLAKGDVNTFSFYDVRTGTTHTNCFYDDFRVGRRDRPGILRRQALIARYAV